MKFSHFSVASQHLPTWVTSYYGRDQQDTQNFFFFIWLYWVLVMAHVSGSLSKVWTQDPCIGGSVLDTGLPDFTVWAFTE